MDDLLEGVDDLAISGAVDPALLRQMVARGQGIAALGTIVKDRAKAAAFIKKAAASKQVAARNQAALLKQVMAHEAQHNLESKKRPTVLVLVQFPALAAAGSSATATIQRVYSGRSWAISMIESYCTVSPDPSLLIKFDPGGVDQAVSPTTQAVSYSAGNPQAGIPSATFGVLNTQRTDSRILYAPWASRAMVFGPTDTFQMQLYNAGAAAITEFFLLKIISAPCAGMGMNLRPVPPQWFSQASRLNFNIGPRR